MKTIRFLTTTGLALAACAATLRAEVVAIRDDTAGLTTITSAGGRARTLAISAKSTAFIRFDTALTGIQPAQVASARLTIYFAGVTKPGSVKFHHLTTDFTETFLEKSKPVPTFEAAAFATEPAVKGEYLTVDVTAQVLQWLATPATGFGVAIKADATVSALIASKEGAGSGHPALLEIETTSFLQDLADDINTTGFITIRSNATTQPGLDFMFDDGAGTTSLFDLANTPTGAFAISRGGNPLFSISSNAALFSMGTSGSGGALDVFGDSGVEITATIFSDAASSAPLIVGQRARGTKAAPTAVQGGDELANFNARGFVDGDFSGSRAKVVMSATQNWTSGANGADISFHTTPNGSAVDGIVERMRITNDGNVGIGTTGATSKLVVQADTTASTQQLILQGKTNPARQLAVGYNTTNNHGVIQAIEQGINPRNLLLNPSGGNVGIGTGGTAPSVPLEVGSFLPFTGSRLSLYINGGIDETDITNSLLVSIKAAAFIGGAGFIVYSDARTKRIEGRSGSAADLATLGRIEITDYTHKDVIAKGSRPQKKVIAQQVEAVYPQAVTKTTDVVPDIYQKAAVNDGWVALATDLKVGERVRLIGDKEQGIHEVLEVRDGAFRTAFQPTAESVFVYGREVKDFHNVDYDAIAMLNVSATQELARKLEAKDAEITALTQKLASLEARDQAREARLTRLENALDDRPARTVRASFDLK